MGAGKHVMRAAALCALALLLAAPSLVAQEPPKPGAKDVRGRAIEKLRALDRASRPATDSVAPDSLAADSVAPGGMAPGSAAAASATANGADEPAVAGAPAGANTDAAPLVVHMSPDSFAAALRNLDGYALTEYRAGERARFVADSGRLELTGSPALTREGQGIRADSLLVYHERLSVLCGYGKPVMEGATGEPVESDQVCYDIDRRQGTALGARTKFTEGATWFVHGNELHTSGEDRLYGASADFTSCDLETPHYHFAAKSVKIVHDRLLVARDVTLTFQDVPVFWLPFMVQSLEQGRRSGLLTPEFQLTDIVRNRSGYDRRLSNIGFYWAINDYMGAKVALDWWSDHWTAVNGAFRYRWQRQFLDGHLDFTQYWREDGSRTRSISTAHSWRPGENTQVSVRANFQSADFVRQFSFDPRQLNRTIQSGAGLNHRFDWGSFNLSADRTQYLHDGRTTMTLPQVSLSINPITLFPSAGEPRWYNNASWNGSTSFTARSTKLGDLESGTAGRDNEARDARITSSFQMGRFSWSQNVNFSETIQGARPAFPDTANPVVVADSALPREVQRAADWSTSFGFSQRLIGTSTFSPSLGLNGRIVESNVSGGEPVVGPTRLRFGASLDTDLYGFWPGFGPFSRLRHHIDPALSYSYSPAPKTTALQDSVFGAVGKRETNELRLTIGQTWEAKYEERDTAAAAADADTSAASLSGEPRRLPKSRKIMLLSLRTTALVYDFTRAREGDYGFRNTDLSHTVKSDLLGGLSVTIGHDLFRLHDVEEGQPQRRTFAPRLRRVSTGFDLDSDSWLFRVLGLGRGSPEPDTASAESGSADPAAADSLGTGFEQPGGSNPFMGPDRSGNGADRVGHVGNWRAGLKYSLVRPPAGQENGREDQFVSAAVSFQPTENWSVRWNTGYSFTEGEFADHVLTFSRDLHRWQANFDFIKSQNGNFMFSFRVQLLDNNDIHLDYDERYEGPAGNFPR